MHDLVTFLHHFCSFVFNISKHAFDSYFIYYHFSFLRRKVVVKMTFLIQKSLNFNIFLLFSEIVLKIINFLNLLIFIVFSRAVSVFSMFDLYIKIIISIALIFCICFIFYFLKFMLLILSFCLIFVLKKRWFCVEKTLKSRLSTVWSLLSFKCFLQSCFSSSRLFFSIFQLFSSISLFIFRNIH